MRLSALVVLTGISVPLFTLANPQGGQITHGNGSIEQQGNHTTIQQHSDRMVIDWNSYDLQANESIRYHQPSRDAINLNRIHSNSASHIHGRIDANGQVILVNPNGIFFGENARVNVGGLFASGLNLSAEDFMAGRLDFNALENTRGLIVNHGTLQALDGGNISLLGQQIKNHGVIVANLGTVGLVAGNHIRVTLADQPNIHYRIEQNTVADLLGLDDPQIFNSGLIQAHGGRVFLSTQQAQALQSSAIHQDYNDRWDGTATLDENGEVILGNTGDIENTGTIDVSSQAGDAGRVDYHANNINHSGQTLADSTAGNGGHIGLHANDTLFVRGGSLISAQALLGELRSLRDQLREAREQGHTEQIATSPIPRNDRQGGTIHLLGDKVGITDQAEVNASGIKGGGEVLVGGDYLGSNPDIHNAEAVYIGQDTQIKANAIENGEGGKIIVWSDKVTRAYGTLEAKGGAQRGNGGFIETSSKDYVDLAPTVNVSATNGLHGEWLIDPSNLTIGDVLPNGLPEINLNIDGLQLGPIFESDDDTSNLRIATLQSALENGANITVQTAIIDSVLTTPAGCGTAGNPACDIGDAQPNGGTITLATDLNYNNSRTNRDGENASSLTLNAHRDIIIDGEISDSDPTNFINDGTDDIPDMLNLALNAGRHITINNDINLQGGNFSATGEDLTVNQIPGTPGAYYDINTTIAATGYNPGTRPNGDITLTMNGNVALGDIFADGDLTVNADGDINFLDTWSSPEVVYNYPWVIIRSSNSTGDS